MSTTAVIPSTDTVATLPIKKENVNFAVVAELAEDGKIKAVRHTSSEKDIAYLKSATYQEEEMKKKNPKIEQIAFEQTVVKPYAGTLEGFAELVPDKEEQLNIINKGLSAKFNQKIRTVLIEQDEAGNFTFQPIDGAFDATSLVQEPTVRVTMSPTDKALKMLAGLDETTRNAILAQFAAIATSQSAE